MPQHPLTFIPNRPVLYRFWNADHELLYIGVTQNIHVRLAQHLQTQPWAHEIAAITVQLFRLYEYAREAEGSAIHSERPKYNQHDPVRTRLRRQHQRPRQKRIDPVMKALERVWNPTDDEATRVYHFEQRHTTPTEPS